MLKRFRINNRINQVAAVDNEMATNPNRRNMRTKINNNLINAENSKVETVLGFGVELLSYVLRQRNNKEQKNGEV